MLIFLCLYRLDLELIYPLEFFSVRYFSQDRSHI
jgi:hypothetical protein